MTDKSESPNQPDTDNNTPPNEPDTSSRDDFGVESALAALGALAGSPQTATDEVDDRDAQAESDTVPETNTSPGNETDNTPDTAASVDVVAQTDDSLADDAPPAQTTDSGSAFSQTEAEPHTLPEITLSPGDKLYRGQAASVVPALLLIGIGALLTFLLTASDDVIIDPLTGGALALMAGGVALLAHWFSTERRATGNLFIGLMLLTGGGLGAYALQSGAALQTAWPLLLLIPGGALLATALIARRELRQAGLIGVLLLLAGAGGFVLTEFIL